MAIALEPDSENYEVCIFKVLSLVYMLSIWFDMIIFRHLPVLRQLTNSYTWTKCVQDYGSFVSNILKDNQLKRTGPVTGMFPTLFTYSYVV